MIITIDGPAASGKSTLAQKLAQRLGIYYLNSGLLYRALAYLLLKKGYTSGQLNHPKKADITFYTDPQRLTYSYTSRAGPHVFFDGQDITSFLKDAPVDTASSLISMNSYVRDRVHELQRVIAQKHPVVVEGRDAGSVVFPNADYKFFLTASVPLRAERWIKQQKKKGATCTLEEAIEHIEQRDERDIQRNIAPLVVPKGAEVVDNSELSSAETVKMVQDKIRI